MFNSKKAVALMFYLQVGAVGAEMVTPDAGTGVVPRACVECHGRDGGGVTPDIPNLDGQLHSYLIESMDLLKVGLRPTAVDNHLPPDITPEQIRQIADHYSRAVAPQLPESFDSSKIGEGRLIYSERCMHCHEDNGRETDERGLGSPFIAGQKMSYLRTQMLAYLKRERDYLIFMKEHVFAGRPIVINGHPIRGSIGRLSASDIEALTHFLGSVSPRKAGGRKRR